MPYESGYDTLRSFASVSADAAPTTASSFTIPSFTPNDDSVEVAFGEFTTAAADNTASVELWLKTRDETGAEIVTMFADVGTIESGSTSHALPRVQLTDIPSGAFYARLSGIAGTTPTVTGTVYIRSLRTRLT